MRLYADENLHADIVAWLRSRGHDVTYAAEFAPGLPDESVLEHAHAEGRIVVTDDKDFGALVIRRGLASPGVILLRQREARPQKRIARLLQACSTVEEGLPGSLVVVTDGKIRVRSLPPPP